MYGVFLLFLIYSAFGWFVDTAYRSAVARRFTTGDGFPLPRLVPFSPIYGFGALTAVTLRPLIDPLPLAGQFVALALALAVVEYAGGVVSERVAGRRLWDYSKQPFNLHGRVRLFTVLAWGALGLLLIHAIHPFVEGLIAK